MKTLKKIRRRTGMVFWSLLLMVSLTVSKARAQSCVSSSDGTISSLMGSDFDNPDGKLFFEMDASVDKFSTDYMKVLPDPTGDAIGCTYKGTNKKFDPALSEDSYTGVSDINVLLHDDSKWKKNGLLNNNSFIVAAPNFHSGHFFEVYVNHKAFRGRTVTFTYKCYIIKTNTNYGAHFSPMLDIGMHDGFGSYNGQVEIVIDDMTGSAPQTIKYPLTDGNGKNVLSFGAIDYTENYSADYFNKYMEEVCIEAKFTLQVKDYANSAPLGANQTVYRPYINMYGMGTYALAYDYVNMKMQHVCANKSEACFGDEILLTAHDYIPGAKIVFEYSLGDKDKNGNEIYKPTDGKTYTIDAKGNATGSHIFPNVKTRVMYRARIVDGPDGDNNAVTGGASLPVYVDARDEAECSPADPGNIKGDAKVCAPAKVTYTIDNIDTDATYKWTLIDPDNKDVSNNADYNKVGAVVGGSVDVNFPATKEGVYTLKVYGYRGNNTALATKVVEKKITVVAPVSPLDFEISNNGAPVTDICPSDLHSDYTVTAKHNMSATDFANAKFEWWADRATTVPDATDKNKMHLAFDTKSYCSGLYSAVNYKLTITKNGCPTTATGKIEVKKTVNPTITCASKPYEFVITQSGTSEYDASIPVPKFSVDCDPNPSVAAEVTYPDKTKKIFDLTGKTSLDTKFPAGESSVKFIVTDGCGNKAECSVAVKVTDSVAPDVDCDAIPDYTVKLSQFSSCVATPGVVPELPVLTAPELVDLSDGKNTVLVGEYVGRARKDPKCNKDACLYLSNIDKTIGLNDDFEYGKHIIVWKFTDAFGNFTYCQQNVFVWDDMLPTLSCPSIDFIVSDTGKCGASVGGMLAQYNPRPVAKNRCTTTKPIAPVVEYRKKGATDWISLGYIDSLSVAEKKQVVFDVNETYEVKWTFWKKDAQVTSEYIDQSVYVECIEDFEVVDNEAPVLNCEVLGSYVVNANTASKKGKDEPKDQFEYNKQNPADRVDIDFVPGLADATDNCGVAKITVTLNTSEGKDVQIETDKPYTQATLDAIKKKLSDYKYKLGVNRVSFTLEDVNGNKSESCQLQIIVVSDDAPVANCPANKLELVADNNCEADGSFSLATMPTATVTYTYYDATVGWVGFSEQRTATVYPISIKRTSGTDVKICNNDSKTEKVLERREYQTGPGGWPGGWPVFPGYGPGPMQTKDTYLDLQTKNFKTLPACLADKFPLGTTTLEFTYDNGKGGKSVCVVEVIVTDETKPVVVCGDWNKTINASAGSKNCSVTGTQIGIKMPSAADLKATDNCTETGDLVVDYNRCHIESGLCNIRSLEDDYILGTTEITWIVKDKSGNQATCKTTVIVTDNTAPEVNCNNIPNITVDAGEDCMASAEVVIKSGLEEPQVDDDLCTPTGGVIKGVGTRSDGKEIFTDPYPLGETTITWVFADAAGNDTFCVQSIIVEDNTKPVFAECGNLPDIVISLPATACVATKDEVEALLGTRTAEDNCGGTITGVPVVKPANELPATFPVDTTIVTWIFDDGKGNVLECEQKVVVEDKNAPDITGVCHDPEVKIEAPKTCEITVEDLGWEDLYIEDLCDGKIYADPITRSDGKDYNDPYPIGTTTVTWTFTDKSGNSSTCVTDVVVLDTLKPVLTCSPVSDLLFVMDKDNCSLSADSLAKALIVPKAYDECDTKEIAVGEDGYWINAETERWYLGPKDAPLAAPLLVVDANGNPVAWDDNTEPYKVGITNIYFIFKDKSGNVDTCFVKVELSDKNPPYIDCSLLTDTLSFFTPDGGCEVSYQDLNIPGQKAMDLCLNEEVEGVAINKKGGSLFNPNIPEKLAGGDTLDIRWIFTGSYGAQAECPQAVVIVDNQKPVIDCDTLNTITLMADANECFVSGAEDSIKVPVATDNCGDIVGVPTRSDGLTLADPFPTGTTTITWTFADSNPANDVTCSQDVFVKGNKKVEIDCDTLYPILDTIAGCDISAQQIVVNIPVGIDNCAPDGQKEVKGTFIRSDGKTDLTDFPLGNTTITWTFTDFTNSAEAVATCSQIVNLRTEEEMVKTNCDAVKKVKAPDGVCAVDVSLSVDEMPVAVHPCDNSIVIPGVPYLNGTAISFPRRFPVGITEITWVFTDTTNSLVNNPDTCFTKIQVGDSNDMPVDCKNMPDKHIVLDPNDCEITAAELNIDTTRVYDLCTGSEIVPEITRLDGTKIDYHNVGAQVFSVGRDTIFWTYKFTSAGNTDADVITCKQEVWVQDKDAIKFDCSDLDTLKINADPGKCEITGDAIIASLGNPEATDMCLNKLIAGVASKLDGTKLPNKLAVGDTLIVKWVFSNPDWNSDSVVCEQVVFAIGDQAPVFNCDDLDTLKFTVDGECKLVIPAANIPVPNATDACKPSILVPGKPSRLDGAAMTDEFPVGNTVIRWVFTSPFSTLSDTCEQVLNLRTDLKIDFDCEKFTKDTLLFETIAGECDRGGLDTVITAPVAKNPCTGEDIVGVPDIDLTKRFPVGNLQIKWTFTDTTETLVDFVDECIQNIIVKDGGDIDIDCDTDLPDLTFELDPGVCEIYSREFNIDVPVVKDNCDPNIAIIPSWHRMSGLEIQDPFSVGTDTLYWTYQHNGNKVVCAQGVTVLGNSVKIDCDTKLPPLAVPVDKNECEIGVAKILDALAKLEPKAYDECIADSIAGVYDKTLLPATLKVGDTLFVDWQFYDKAIHAKPVICTQVVTALGDQQPIFECSSLDTIKLVAEDGCQRVVKVDDIKVPEAEDACVKGYFVKATGVIDGDKTLPALFQAGIHTITWTFKSPYSSAPKVCDQLLNILSPEELDAPCDKLTPIQVPVADGECSVEPSVVLNELPSPYPTVTNPCTGDVIIGVPSRADGKPLDSPYFKGVTVIVWTFTDKTNTLAVSEVTCEQTVKVGDSDDQLVDCRKIKNVTVALDIDNCNLDAKALNLNVPVVTNPCYNNEVVIPDTARKSGLAMTAPFEVGSDTIIWSYTLKVNDTETSSFDCPQVITVIDTIAPYFDCNKLESIIKIPLTDGATVPYDTAVFYGLKKPEVTDKCSDVTVVGSRSDGKELTAEFENGTSTVVKWTFSDVYGNEASCSQTVVIEDLIPIDLNCSGLPSVAVGCDTDVPAAYGTLNEFIAAGGSVSDLNKIKPETFTFRDEVPDNFNSCDYRINRVYTVNDFLNRPSTCVQELRIRDTIRPELKIVVSSNATISGKDTLKGNTTYIVTVSCEQDMPAMPEIFKLDNCSSVDEITVDSIVTNSRAGSPQDCDYYNYSISRRWWAVDKCGNHSDTVAYVINIVDTVPPVINVSEKWKEDFVVADYLKRNCEFGVPDVRVFLPEGSVYDDCQPTENIKITQYPEPGTVIMNSTTVWIRIEDLCGNIDSVSKLVYVPERESIVKLTPRDTAICGSDDNRVNLSSPLLCQREGSLYLYDDDFNEYVPVYSQLFFDYYKGEISEENLIYSNNFVTNGQKFAKLNSAGRYVIDRELADSLLKIRRMTQTETYVFVAMDTITFCSDTAVLHLTVNERPRVTLDDILVNICEDDSIQLYAPGDELYDRANVCVSEMGTFPITEEGWMLGDSVYAPNQLVPYSDRVQRMTYYATNLCGTTTSFDSYFLHCGTLPTTEADSLAILDGDVAKLALWKKDDLVAYDTFRVETRHRLRPQDLMLTTDPQDKARVYLGDNAKLVVKTNYTPASFMWYKVDGYYDGRYGVTYNKFGEIDHGQVDADDNSDILLGVTNANDSKPYTFELEMPKDSALYYVIVTDSVCPAVVSNVVSIDVIDKLPTAITPYKIDGMNDIFMEGHTVSIFNRYGQKLFDGDNGWDGTYRGQIADPGVYFYEVQFQGAVVTGTIEVVKME